MKWIAPHGAATSTERYRNAEPTIAGSNPDAAFFNTVLDELLAVIVAADMTPTDANLHQIADAIEYLTERAATSGVTKGSYWFGKTSANFTVPNPTLPEQNYIDFTTLNTYSAKSDLSGWTQTGTFVPPAGIDFTILITSKFWDIPEQDGQQGGWAQYNHTDDEWSWWPKIISFKDAALTGTPTAPTPPTENSSTQIATTAFVSTAVSTAVSNILSNVYPVGAIYIGTQSTCPMAALISGSTWELVSAGKALWTGDGTNGNTTIAAGLPNITGQWGANTDISASASRAFQIPTNAGAWGAVYGAFSKKDEKANMSNNFVLINPFPGSFSTAKTSGFNLVFDASKSNSVYGNSSTVQPPAYVVNVWRRTA